MPEDDLVAGILELKVHAGDVLRATGLVGGGLLHVDTLLIWCGINDAEPYCREPLLDFDQFNFFT